MVGNREREKGKDEKEYGGMGREKEGWEGEEGGGKGERVWKGREGGLDLDICPGTPEFLVTPLMAVPCGTHMERCRRLRCRRGTARHQTSQTID